MDIQNYTHNYSKSVFVPIVPMVYTPAFKKVTKLGGNKPNIVEFSSGTCLRRLRHILKLTESLYSETLIYDRDKEFLVDTVNRQTSMIAHKVRENIETLQVICDMDRTYRKQRLRTIDVQNAFGNFYEHLDLCLNSNQGGTLEESKELIETLAPDDISGIDISEFNTPGSNVQNLDQMSTPSLKSEKIISETATNFGDEAHSSTSQVCEEMSAREIREDKSLIFNDVNLQNALGVTTANNVRRNYDFYPNGWNSIISPNSNSYRHKLLERNTKPVSKQSYVFRFSKAQ